MRQRRQEYRVVALSSNTNSFGLRGVVLVSRDGRAYEVGRSVSQKPDWPIGHAVLVNETKLQSGWCPQWAPLGVELDRRLHPDPPADVVRRVFAKPAAK